MRLRSRFEQILSDRVAQYLPAALETVWDKTGVVAAIESLKFSPNSGSITDKKAGFDVEFLANVNGVVRVEIRMDEIGALVIEPLLASLVGDSVFVPLDPEVAEGGITEKARLTLIDLRDAIRETQVVSVLRFTVDGVIMRRLPDAQRPALMIGEAPAIGAGHEGDYDPLEIGGGILP